MSTTNKTSFNLSNSTDKECNDKVFESISNAQFCNIKDINGTNKKHYKKIPKQQYTKPHKCEKCLKTFNVLENLTLHMSTHNSQLRCPQCGKIFSRIASLKGHIRIHFKNEYFQCNLCSEIFHYEIKLHHHMHINHRLSVRSDNCKITSKTMHSSPVQPDVPNDNSSCPSTHEIDRIVKRKEHQCVYCEKIFLRSSSLKRHERIHRNERPYSCESCRKSFTQKNSLTVHQLTVHTGKRPHECPDCPQRFAQKTNLLVHINRCHSMDSLSDVEFSCSQCTCKFKKLSSLTTHVGRWHKKIIDRLDNESNNDNNNSSTEVDIVMVQLNEIAQPASINEKFQMDVDKDNSINSMCHSTELKSENLSIFSLIDKHPDGKIVHYNAKTSIKNGVRLFICTFCDKKCSHPSDMIRHFRTHTKEKPYKCEICERQFALKVSLKVHMQIHNKDQSNQFNNNRISKNVFNGVKNKLALQDNNNATRFKIAMAKPILLTDKQHLVVKNNSSETIKYECYICHNLFKLKYSLKQHIESHFGIKRFKCQHCGK